MFGHRSATFLCLLTFSVCIQSAWSVELTNVLADGKRPNDLRLGKLKNYKGYFPFEVPASSQEWEERATELRRRVKVATGLWPMPKRTPLRAVIHGRVEREGFTIEKVYFESVPNHFVTGLLFRPRGKSGPLPAVLCPHGHGGRMQDYGAEAMPKLIEQGAERFEHCGRYPKLSRCVQLARMGCVTFIFDMIGYVDNVQLTHHLAHRTAKRRPEFEGQENWGFFSTQAELRMQSIMGLQSWNAIRSLDFLASLPDVNPDRIGVTGGSGGGTQTILLGVLDPRPIVAFPNGMVSTAMQGGCTCENCNLLRVGTGNVELAALFAPKPMGMTAANDWTKDMMTKGFPELQQLYAMLGAQDQVICEPLLRFPHNYNYVSRAVMYHWFNKHMQLGLDEPIIEEAWEPLTSDELAIWDESHPKPEGGAAYERALIKWMAEQSDQQIAALTPKDAASLEKYREIVGTAVEVVIRRGLPPAGSIKREEISVQNRGDLRIAKELLRNVAAGEELPLVTLSQTKAPGSRHIVIWVDGRGKAGIFGQDEKPNPAVQQLLEGRASIVSADLFLQGEFLSNDKPLDQQPVVDHPREVAAYTYCYNDTVFVRRVHDILSLVSSFSSGENAATRVDLIGVNGAGPLVAAARAIAGNTIDRAAIDTQGFRFANLSSYRDPNFLPGIVKYGDLPALLALSAPHPLWIGGESEKTPTVATAAFQASNAKANLTTSTNGSGDIAMDAAKWILEK